MKTLKKIFLVLFTFSVTLVFNSCSGIVGYSVVLWNIPEYSIADGTVVPVYLKSNITQEYIIKLPDSSEKVSVPLWKLAEPVSKSKAHSQLDLYLAYNHKYAKCVLDGLPIRAEALNTSKQVYRLRKDEIIRVLYEGNGVIPTNGKEELTGVWIRVLTSNGTQGWCFSQSLRIFEMNSDGSYGEGAEEAKVQKQDDKLDIVLKKKWYPDYYSQMISKKTIDLEFFNTEFGFDTGSETGTVSINMPSLKDSYPYTGVTKVNENVYRFNEAPIQITVRSENLIVVQYTDKTGHRKSFNFITLDESIDIASLITEEEERRDSLYKKLLLLGPSFESDNYGELLFMENGLFSWNSYNLLVPSIISTSARGNGTVEIKYFLPANLKNEWDGILSFKFNGMENEVHFLYKQLESGLRLSNASVTLLPDVTTGRNTVSVSRSVNSTVIFFHY